MKSPLPLPELFEEDDLSFSFKQRRGKNDQRRPPKLQQPFNRSVNASMASVISFRMDDSRTELNTLYNRNKSESYYEQCFEQLMKVGEGSFGEVFKVRSRADGLLYAVKKSKAHFRSSHSRQVRLEEVRRYEQFSDHENCVKLYQAWEQDDRLYMQMELCRENLEVYAREHQQLPDDRIWSILLDMLLALKSFHDRDLIHLDIKLDNILVTDDGMCKLADFGIVFDLRQGNVQNAMEGDSRYLAPEVMSGTFSKAADIFSLGIAILELACNLELPAHGQMWQRLRSGLPLPEVLMKKVSPALQDVIRSMMQLTPTKRPSVDTLLRHPCIRKQRDIRRRQRVLTHLKSYVHRKVSSLTRFLLGAVMWLMSCFRLQHRKATQHEAPRKDGCGRSNLSFNSNCSRNGTFAASRSFQDQSSALLADEDGDVTGGFDSSTCTNMDEKNGPRNGNAEMDDVQITPTLNNSMPPTRSPTIRIINSTPLNHSHLQQHQLQYHQMKQGYSGSKHMSRVLCSPLRNLWFEDDPDDLALMDDLHRNNTTNHSRLMRHNDSDNDFRPLGSLSEGLDGSTNGDNSRGNQSADFTSGELSHTSTPNCSLHRTMRDSNGSGMCSSFGCDTPISGGFASFIIKKKLRFNAEDDSE